MTGTAIRTLVVGAVAVAVLFAPPASAEQPFRLDSQIVDRVGALDGREAEVQEAIDELQRDEQIQLWVAYVDSFSGVGAQEWADQTAEQSDLGLSDVLLAVATGDRAYAYSVDEQFPLSNDELARIADQSIEPELSDGDWAGAAVAAASGLEAAAGGQASTDGDGGGGWPGWLWPLLAGLALLGLLWWFFRRRSRDRAERSGSSGRGRRARTALAGRALQAREQPARRDGRRGEDERTGGGFCDRAVR